MGLIRLYFISCVKIPAWIIEMIYNFLGMGRAQVVEAGYLLGFSKWVIFHALEVTGTRDLLNFLVVNSADLE